MFFSRTKDLAGRSIPGLKHVTGKYLCWPDADDYLESDSIELRLRFLEENTEYAVVTSDAFVRNEGDSKDKFTLVSASYNTNHDPDQFIHMLNGKTIFCSGSHMVCTEHFFKTHQRREIYPARKGQNYQMLLPIYHKYKRYFLDKPLYNYIQYKASMSKIDNKNLNEIISRDNQHKEIILQTLATIEMGAYERKYYLEIISSRFSRLAFRNALIYKDYHILRSEYSNLKKLRLANAKINIQYFFLMAMKTLEALFINFFSRKA